MNILIVGASGATGRLLTKELLNRGQSVKVIVRTPDKLPADLNNHDNLSVIHPSPIRSAIFDPGQTSRINVGHFMADLITNDHTWQQWQGQMPVIYNKADSYDF